MGEPNKKPYKELFLVFFVILPIAIFCITLFLEMKRTEIKVGTDGLTIQNKIVNAHEHFQSYTNAPKFLEAMDNIGVGKTLIVGSPEATILMGREGFFGEHKYNMEVLKLANTYPDRFIAFPTINWKDDDKLEKLKKYVKMGGKGLKLYNGHTYFQDREPLDEESMMAIYEYCEKEGLPILYHVNAGHYLEEFERVLKRFPKMKVICPHFCLSTINSARFEYLMKTYPNLYTDISLGFIEFLTAGLKRFSRSPEKYRDLMIRNQDRILFGTDIVITSAKYKTVEWLTEAAVVYRNFLELEEYEFFELPGKKLKGLNLDREVLDKIYYKNFENLMAS